MQNLNKESQQSTIVVGYKANLQKSMVFLYTRNNQLEKKKWGNISIKTATKSIKQLVISIIYLKKTKTKQKLMGKNQVGCRKYTMKAILSKIKKNNVLSINILTKYFMEPENLEKLWEKKMKEHFITT